MTAKSQTFSDRDLIYAIGIRVLIDHYGYPRHSVLKWVQRGIPWKDRARVRRIGARRGYKTPRSFLEVRRV